MSKFTDSTDDFKAYKNALAAAAKPDAKRKDSKISPTRMFVVLGLFGFLVAWTALAIYGGIKIMEKIGWI